MRAVLACALALCTQGALVSNEYRTNVASSAWYATTGSWSAGRFPREGDKTTVPTAATVSIDSSTTPKYMVGASQGTMLVVSGSLEVTGNGSILKVGAQENAPQHCAVGDWSVYTVCTKTCGGGSQRRERTLVQPRYGGNLCPHGTETRVCNAHPCPVDCKTSAWKLWSACTKSCGGGSQRRSRVQVEPKLGGKACPHHTETRPCNGHVCPADCKTYAWEKWSTCTKSCGGGSQRRSRKQVEPHAGGKACPHYAETRKCNSQACAVDCKVAVWQPWSKCTKSCNGGSQRRTRANVEPRFGGKACPHYHETRLCNAHLCINRFLPKLDTWYSKPASWSLDRFPRIGDRIEISHTAVFKGEETPAYYNGACQGEEVILMGDGVLNIHEGGNVDFNIGHQASAPQHCVVFGWGSWGACDKSCGAGRSTRSRNFTQPRFGGDRCPPATEHKPCTHGPCPVHCSTSAFSAWTSCTKSCGTGTQTRSRSITTHARHGGYVCPYLVESRNCNKHTCAIPCVVGKFRPWGDCTKSCGTGSQRRSRPLRQPENGGKKCPHGSETRKCNAHQCPKNCKTSAWQKWSSCTKSCGGGSQRRIRNQDEPEFGGTACPHYHETRLCNPHPCPQDCKTSAWKKWSTCTKSCGTGSQRRGRSQVEPVFGGKACPHYTETRKCNVHKCPKNCKTSAWKKWSACTKSCGGGSQSRSRIQDEPEFGGTACPHYSETRPCNNAACPVDCVTKSWGKWSKCSKSCGTGSQKRSRHQTEPSFGGKACPHYKETRRCTDGNCPVHCVTTAFSQWTYCTKSCGKGSQSRSRSVISHARHGGYVCPYLEETRDCNTNDCPQNCKTSAWGKWSSCTKSCDHGSQRRSRKQTEPRFGGRACPHYDETRSCNRQRCPQNCRTFGWQPWSTCTKSCGSGSQRRSRQQVEPLFGGKACPHYKETRPCNVHACPTDCRTFGWQAWSTCTKSCGTGLQRRQRKQVEPRLGGKACPHYTETRKCNVHACPRNCRIESWGGWSACSKKCNTGAQHRKRDVTQPQHGGTACPHSLETRACNAKPCACTVQGTAVPHGYHFTGSGKNFCNSCRCHNGQHVCTKRACETQNRKVCDKTTCTYGLKFQGKDDVMSVKDAIKTYGTGLKNAPAHEMTTLVHHWTADKNGSVFRCGVTDHTKRLTGDVKCMCFCTSKGRATIWHHHKRDKLEVTQGKTSAGCKCKARWAWNGRTFAGCQNPKIAGKPLGNMHAITKGGWSDNHGAWPYPWCQIEPGSCTPGRVPAGIEWDTCEATAHNKITLGATISY